MMETVVRFRIILGLIIGLPLLTAAQELSKIKCDEYSRKNEMLFEPNEYRKYMNKFVRATTAFKEYDAVLISEEYALTSVPTSLSVRFKAVIVNNISVEVERQEKRDDIYLIKLLDNVELYHKIVCLWNSEELPLGYDFFTVVHESGLQRVPFLRTYLPNTHCPIVQPDSQRHRYSFCLYYENGRQSESVFENPTASSLIFLKSFHNGTDLNKNVYLMGVLQRTNNIVHGRKLWPNLRWIENVVWKGEIDPPPLEPECGTVVVADSNKLLISSSQPTYPGEFPWQAALFEVAFSYINNTINTEYMCGGSLLNQDTILTAAHCVVNRAGQVKQPAKYIVKLGLYNLDGTESSAVQIISVFKFIKHESYNITTFDSDIALIKLNSLVTYSNFVRPICLNDNVRAFQVQEGVVAGWGLDEKNVRPNTQRKGTLIIPSRNDCRHKTPDFIKELLTDSNYCAANKDGQSVCKGDSGSGMITEDGGRWYVRGVVSFGGVHYDGTCNPQEYSLFTNTTPFYTWIVSKMQTQL